MKRLFVILTLIISSFFLFSLDPVKADTTTYVVNETEMDYINEDFLKLRELAIEYCNENNKYYLIIYESNISKVYFFETADITLTYNSKSKAVIFGASGDADIYYLSNDDLFLSGSGTGTSTTLSSGSNFTYVGLLDTNFENLNYTGTVPFIIQYNDLSYSIEEGSVLPTLYQIYLDSNVKEDDDVVVDDNFNVEDKEVVSNFYSMVIEKIDYLASIVVKNYILLLAIGVFILVFVIELIFRRFI